MTEFAARCPCCGRVAGFYEVGRTLVHGQALTGQEFKSLMTMVRAEAVCKACGASLVGQQFLLREMGQVLQPEWS